eukprot:Em0013g1076a
MESDIVDDLSDDLIRDVFTYLSTNKYPEASSSSRKRVIRKKALKFFISTSGELMYKQKLKGKEPTFLRYVQSPEERRLILLACHVHPTSGHMGRTRTLHRIKERVMWHGMVKDCTEMIRTCDICQRMNRKLTCGVPELHPIPVKSPWYMIGIDFIGPISPPGEDGSQYILTISDYFTKWVEAIPTPDKTATTVANCLFKIFMRMGLPRVMLSDNGSEFCNKLNDKLAEILGVKRRLTTPYHPQANGLDERYNQTLQNMLAKFVSTKQTVWSSYLDTCTFAYNTSRHESSTYTPFQLMFGRQAILPVDIDLQKESGDELHHKYQMLNDPDIVAVQHKHQVILEDAKKHILDAQKKQKQKVVKKMPHGVYELISKDGTLIRATGGHLKMYHSNMLQGSISCDDKQASSKVISDDPSTSGVKPDDTSICSDIECYDPSTPSDAKHDGLPTPSNIGCDDTLTPSDAEHDRLPTPSNIGCDDTLTPSDAEHDRLPTPSNIGCDDTLTTSDVEHDGLTTPSNTGCDDTLTTSDVERDGLTTPSDVGCDDDTHTISHAKPDDQPTTSDTEPKDLLTLKDAEPPVLLFCSCKTRCATKRCLCKLNHSFCGHYCHPDLMHSAGKQITVQYVSVQYQKGSQDCGLFAIAFACEICFGKDPSSVTFVQSTMRQHLIEGLEQGNILPFPSAVRRQSKLNLTHEDYSDGSAPPPPPPSDSINIQAAPPSPTVNAICPQLNGLPQCCADSFFADARVKLFGGLSDGLGKQARPQIDLFHAIAEELSNYFMNSFSSEIANNFANNTSPPSIMPNSNPTVDNFNISSVIHQLLGSLINAIKQNGPRFNKTCIDSQAALVFTTNTQSIQAMIKDLVLVRNITAAFHFIDQYTINAN